MPRKKEYSGRPVINKRASNRRMFLIGDYKRGNQVLGIYHDAFDVFVETLRKRIKANQQNVIIVDGDTGAGKSTLAIQICIELAKKLDVSFDLKRDYIYSFDDLWDKLQDPDASPINLIDEGSLLLSSKNSMSRENKDMVNLFNTMRSRGWSTVICAPSIFQIDKGVRTIHADYRVHCSSEDHSLIKGYGRGFFEVSKAKRSEFSRDSEPYWYLLYTGVFGKLPDKVDKEYQPIKREAQSKLIKNIVDKNREREKRYMKRYQIEEDEESCA